MLNQEKVAVCPAVRSTFLATFIGCMLLFATPSFAASGDCASCHGDNVAAGHHASELYSQGLCNQCHEGVTTNGDCASCHTFVPQQNGHHDTTAATSGNCMECHTNVGDLADCLDCHQGSIRTPHHTAASADPNNLIDCASCHSTMEPLAGCIGCHDGNVQNAHHTAAETDGISCQECHSAMAPVSNCESCHNPTDYWAGQTAQETHHASAAAQADCTSCHTNAPRPFNCHDCHQGEAADRHHVLLGGTLTCSNCHDDIQVDVKATTTDCQSCHAPSEANQQQHHDMAITNPALSCNTCHSDAGNVPGCATCHNDQSWGAGVTARDAHHEFTVEPGVDCSTCHSSMVFNTSCDACHSSGDERMQEHHNPDNPNRPANLSCGFCHGSAADVPTVAGDPDASCLFCHDSAFWQSSGRAGSSMDQHHDVVLASPGVTDCATCHDSLVPQTCATCHDDAFWQNAGRIGSAEAQHHDVVRVAGAGLACADCHAGGLPGENNDCQACHTGEAQAFHHEQVAPGLNCQECHTELPVVVDCESCHTPDQWLADARTDHHNSPSFNGTDCMQCHAGVSLAQNCEACHTPDLWVADTKTDHHEAAMTNGTNCNTCHASITTPSGNCRSCHGADWNVPDPVTNRLPDNLHHATTRTQVNGAGFGCMNCHVYSPTYQLLMPPEGSCESCHAEHLADDKNGSSGMHHLTQAATSNQCGECHAGIENITAASLVCATCHSAQPVVNGSSDMHHASSAATDPGATCSDCHATITQASLDCATCHSQQTARVDLDGTPTMHHETPGYLNNQCTNCHQNVVALDCAGCHIDDTDPSMIPIPKRHHESPFAQASTSCSDCHTGADVVTGNCELCHVGEGQPQISDRHHATPSYTPDNCASCHEGIDGVSGDALDCAVCHADKNRNGDTAMHHGTADGKPAYGVDNCSTCHNVLDFDQLMAADECFNCHSGGNHAVIAGRHHSTEAAQPATENCAVCHTVDQAQLDCATCHEGQSPKDGKAAMHHATPTATAPDAACVDCHASVDVSNVTCATCHASQPVFNGGLEMHHSSTTYNTQECTSCHGGADSALMDCDSCHTDPNNPDPNQIAARHHSGGFANAPTTACTDCHSSVNTSELDCALCHTTQPADLSGSVSMHHDLTIAGTTKECATCHAGATIVENDCSSCHTSDNQQIAEAHHATPTYQLGDCSVCHVGAEAQGITCASCHTSKHHDTSAQYAANNCNLCHTDITLNGANCVSCHTGGGQTIPETHHAAPLTSVGGDCAVCHQSVSTPDVCANCHTSVPHHSTQAADYGLCESCHTWPADKNENPQQGACRQCHGQYMHGKNSAAPIHDYRACFDCHGSGGNMTSMFPTAAVMLPFHASPGRAVGFSSNSDAQAPGRGVFNTFYSSWGGKSRNEERFGENEDWENLADDVQRSSVSHSRVQISEQGQTYSVPAFSNIPAPDVPGGGTTPGGGGGLDVCTNCHVDRSSQVDCNNSKWTTHLSSSWVDLATYQLAESTYLGSYCGGGTEPPPSGGDNDVNPSGSYVEAEGYSSFGNNFSEQSDSSASGGTYLRADDNNTSSPGGSATSYELNFTETGTYYIWFLGNSNGSSGDNSLWYGLDGNRVGNVDFSTSSGYRWTQNRYNDGPDPTRITISSVGVHTINIWARENGLRFDGFFLSKSSSTSPSTGGSSGGDPSGGGNLAENKSVSASDDEGSSYRASRAVDGDAGTRWYVRSSRDEWLKVDLGQRFNVSRVVIKWHSEYAREYDVEVSTDNRNWTRVKREESGDGGTETVTFSSRDARYILIDCKRERDRGYSIYELEVYE